MGQGSYGMTFKVMHKETKRLYVLKAIQINQKSWMTSIKINAENILLEESLKTMLGIDYCRVGKVLDYWWVGNADEVEVLIIKTPHAEGGNIRRRYFPLENTY